MKYQIKGLDGGVKKLNRCKKYKKRKLKWKNIIRQKKFIIRILQIQHILRKTLSDKIQSSKKILNNNKRLKQMPQDIIYQIISSNLKMNQTNMRPTSKLLINENKLSSIKQKRPVECYHLLKYLQ